MAGLSSASTQGARYSLDYENHGYKNHGLALWRMAVGGWIQQRETAEHPMPHIVDFRLDASGQRSALPGTTLLSDELCDDKERRRYCCAICKNIITSDQQAVSIQGGHHHCKINPQGRQYHIRCFASAPGCVLAGEFSDYFSWFKEYRWRFAHCAGCHVQLGWFFAGSAPFFALIEQQVVPCKE